MPKTVKFSEESILMRIHIEKDDTYQDIPLYEHIINTAKDVGLANTIAINGLAGYGTHSLTQSNSNDKPIMVEIVDSQPKIDQILPLLDDCIEEGFITMEKVEILKYRSI